MDANQPTKTTVQGSPSVWVCLNLGIAPIPQTGTQNRVPVKNILICLWFNWEGDGGTFTVVGMFVGLYIFWVRSCLVGGCENTFALLPYQGLDRNSLNVHQDPATHSISHVLYGFLISTHPLKSSMSAPYSHAEFLVACYLVGNIISATKFGLCLANLLK